MKFHNKIFIPVMLAMLLAGCSKSTDVELPFSSTNEEAINLYRGAQSAWAENNGPKGRDMMEKALSLDPDFILANLNVPTNDPNKWQEYRDKAKLNSANGNDHEKLQVKLWVAAREGRSDDYIYLCKELVSKYPNSSEAYVELGNAYTGVENFDLAIENYKKAIDINPNQYRAWRGLASHEVTFGGNTLLPKNRQSKKAALQYAKGMVKARPNAPFSYQAKGNIERQYGDMKAARTQYEKMTEAAIKANHSQGAGYNLIAHTYLFSGDYENAKKNYLLASKNAPHDWSRYSYGEFGLWSYLYEGDYPGALEAADDLEKKLMTYDLLSEAEILDRRSGLQFNRFLAHAYNQNKSGAYDAMRANWRIRQDRLNMNKTKDEVAEEGYQRFNAWMESWYYVLFGDYTRAQKSLDNLYKLASKRQTNDALDGYNALSAMVSLFTGDPEKAVSQFATIEKENNLYYAYFKGLAYEGIGENEKAQNIFAFIANYNFQGWEPGLVRNLAKAKVSS